MAKEVLAVIVGNRDFFPDALVTEARNDLTKVLATLDIEPLMLTAEESKLGAVETWADAKRCGGHGARAADCAARPDCRHGRQRAAGLRRLGTALGRMEREG